MLSEERQQMPLLVEVICFIDHHLHQMFLADQRSVKVNDDQPLILKIDTIYQNESQIERDRRARRSVLTTCQRELHFVVLALHFRLEMPPEHLVVSL